MEKVIKNEVGMQERVTIPENNEAWFVAAACFSLVAGYAVCVFLFAINGG